MSMKRAIVILSVVVALASPLSAAKPSKKAAPASPQSVGMGCVTPPPGWQVTWLQQQGWVSGQVREPSGRFVSFAVGNGGAPAASPARVAQFQWFKTEKLGDGTLHYGMEKKADGHSILEASVLRGGIVANFITPQRDFQSLPNLLAIARSYSEKCPEAARGKK
jgi:hypothetical protein